MARLDPPLSPWRRKLHEIIYEADTPHGKTFDVFLLIAIVASVAAVCLESVGSIRAGYGPLLRVIEWGFTILFTIEYIIRLLCVGRPWRYARSFYGVVDLLSIIPTYLSLFIVGTHSLLVIRALRLLRIFRVFKLAQFLDEANLLAAALRASARKIIVFLGGVSTLILILGTLMYLVEGAESGFSNIPESIYWAIVTMTTVGYGDIAPSTVLGKSIASIAMIMGYGILAVPTGIVTLELGMAGRRSVSTQACPQCSAEGHALDAVYCKRCGSHLHPERETGAD